MFGRAPACPQGRTRSFNEVSAVTEIPEHLLNRSKARREAASGAPAGDAAPTASAPAVATPSAPAKAAAAPAPKAAKPDPAYVSAAKNRKKIPFWAMSGLALLPLWAMVYIMAVKPAEKVVEGPIAVGTTVFASCAGCHAADGSGGAGRVLWQGEVLKTFPHIEDMLNFVYNGSQRYVAANIKVYGDPNREGGAHAPLSYNGNPMPMQGEKAGGALTEAQILGVVCHIRYDISGADVTDEKWKTEYENWCSPESEIYKALAAGSSTFDSLSKDFSMLNVLAVGTDPRASTGS